MRGSSAPTAEGDALDDALARDQALLVSRLRDIVLDRVVREALFVASPSLDDAIEAWLKDPASERARGVVEILTRYLGRMCARATPFGLFSGCSVAPLGKDTRMTLAPRANYERHTRLDTHYLSALCEELEKTPELRSKMRFHPSSGLFRSAGQLRYAEARIEPNARDRSFSLVSVELTPYLEATIERAARGAMPGELAQALVDADAEITLDEARAYIDQLIDTQILASDLAPPVTGREPIYDIVDTLRAAHADVAAERVAGVASELEAMDAAGLGLGQERYKRIATTLSALPAKTELPRLFQVDLFKPAPGSSFGGAPLREIHRTLDVVARMKSERPRGDALQRFRDAFRERYEGREVPLVEVLDEERGLGFDSGIASSSEPAPLLNDIHFPATDPPQLGARRARSTGSSSASAALGSVREWVLDAKDLAALEGRHAGLPARRLRRDGHAGGPFTRGARQWGLQDLDARRLRPLRRRPPRPLLPRRRGADRARPRARARRGGAATRRHLRRARAPARGARRQHSLPARSARARDSLPRSGGSTGGEADRDHRSARLDRRQPRRPPLGAARARDHPAPHERPQLLDGRARHVPLPLLAPVAGRRRRLSAGRGARSRALPYLPRVSLGRTVLALAQWNLRKEDLKPLGADEAADRFRAVQALRARVELPRWIGVADGDNVLTVDLDNVVQVESFVALVKNRGRRPSSRRCSPRPTEMCATGPEGTFVHEVVVPFVRKTPRPSAELAAAAPARFSILRAGLGVALREDLHGDRDR